LKNEQFPELIQVAILIFFKLAVLFFSGQPVLNAKAIL